MKWLHFNQTLNIEIGSNFFRNKMQQSNNFEICILKITFLTNNSTKLKLQNSSTFLKKNKKIKKKAERRNSHVLIIAHLFVCNKLLFNLWTVQVWSPQFGQTFWRHTLHHQTLKIKTKQLSLKLTLSKSWHYIWVSLTPQHDLSYDQVVTS